MKKIKKLKEVNNTINNILSQIETRMFIENIPEDKNTKEKSNIETK